MALPHETTAVRDARVAAGNGQLAGDVRGLPSAVAGVSAVTRTTSFPVGRDGFGFAQPAAPAPTITIRHADGRGPLE